jgi:hypothetical protein
MRTTLGQCAITDRGNRAHLALAVVMVDHQQAAPNA